MPVSAPAGVGVVVIVRGQAEAEAEGVVRIVRVGQVGKFLVRVPVMNTG
ncbi:hypothetical protein [Streptomyces antioxidans]|nr:hypothetical protein [Streptomyces antioxidans]